MKKTINVAIYIYDNAEVLDFSGPFEVFATAGRLSKNTTFNVFLISEKDNIVSARAGFQVKANYTVKNHPDIDVLIVVGGIHSEELNKPDVIAWIAKQATEVNYITSVCTGAFLLAQAKVITDHQVTSHWEDLHELQTMFPSLTVIPDVRFVELGNIITSAGIAAGIDMSLHLVSKLVDEKLAIMTAKQMDYPWLVD